MNSRLFSSADQTRPLGEQFARAQAAANILGRIAVLRDCVKKTRKPLQFHAGSRLVPFSATTPPADGEIHVYTNFDLPNQDAVDYIRNLTPVTKVVFDGLTAQYRNDSFTIAGVTDQRVLQRIRDDLSEIVMQGGTAADFQRAVARLQSEEGVAELSAAEIDNVFQTMTHKAYSAGRFEQMNDQSVLDALPYWQFWTVGDDRVRPEHAVLDQFVALAVDPVWRKIWPPCGWGCRCSVVPLSSEEAHAADANCDDDGMLRLPALAIAEVPQPGFKTILAV